MEVKLIVTGMPGCRSIFSCPGCEGSLPEQGRSASAGAQYALPLKNEKTAKIRLAKALLVLYKVFRRAEVAQLV
ncbi:MAG: hypothetical protein IKS68_07695, partial [Mailhella sp.]|nr:hypothetical protein [Mailhella sp.]